MQDPLLGYGPQGLALKVNPWQSKRSLEAVLLYRGAIVAGWANVEAALIEVALRTSVHPDYIGISDNYPSRIKGRVSYLRKIIELDGPLKMHKDLCGCRSASIRIDGSDEKPHGARRNENTSRMGSNVPHV